MRTSGPVLLVVLLAACSGAGEIPEELEDTNVEFEGIKAIGRGELLHVIRPDLERYARTEDDTVIDDAAFRIAHYYRTQGHAKVDVKYAVSEGGIAFRIEEGPAISPGRLHFRGNKALSGEELKEAMPGNLPGFSPPYSQRLAGVQMQAIVNAYHHRGYIDVQVRLVREHHDEEDDEMHVTYMIAEGRRYILVGHEGFPDVPELRERMRPLIGKPYTPDIPSALESAIVDHYRETGHPFARATITPVVDRGQGTVLLRIDADPGSAAKVSRLNIRGNERTRDGFIRSRVGLDVDQDYSASDLRDSEDRLRDTTLFRTVQVSPGEFDPESGKLVVDVTVEEREPGEVSVRGGYGSLDGLRVGADVGYRNILGGGELVRVEGTFSRFRSRGSGELAIPFIFGTEFRPGVTAYYEEAEFPSFDVSSYGFIPSIGYPILRTLTANAGLRFATIETEEIETGVPPGDLLDFNYMAVFVSARWDERDSPLLTTSGFLLDGVVEWSDISFDSDITFLKASGQFSLFLPLPWDLVLAASARGGFLRPNAKTEEMPISLRYFAGGTNTVRGFEYGTLGPKVGGDPIGGEAFLAFQAELRFPIPFLADLHGAIFADRGNVWYLRDDVDLEDMRYAVGVGLRYHTPAGAIVADTAWNIRNEEDEDHVEFHLSIGFPF